MASQLNVGYAPLFRFTRTLLKRAPRDPKVDWFRGNRPFLILCVTVKCPARVGTMHTLVLSVLAVFAVAIAFAAIRRLVRSWTRNSASNMARQVFPVWAAQGPFRSGAESAAAMRKAWLAVFGPEQTGKMADAIKQHETAYDEHPETWEKTRRATADAADSGALTLAEGIAAAEKLNESFIEDGGHRLEFAKLSDGSVGIKYNQIWSDEEIKEKKRRGSEALISGMGESLINDSSSESQALVAFLSEVYRANANEEPNAAAIGRTFFACLAARDEEPDSALIQTFQELYDAHAATLDDSVSSDLEFSENPGFFERHLRRKHNNPLFPEQDRLVTQEQIEAARERDQSDVFELKARFIDLLSDVQETPEHATGDHIGRLREAIDDLLHRAAEIGGDADAIRDSLSELRDTLIDIWREGVRGNEVSLRALDDAERMHREYHEIFNTPFLAQVQRIPSEDVIPAMLSEPPETIRKVMSLFEGEKRATIVREASGLLESVIAEGADISLADEKLRAVRGEE